MVASSVARPLGPGGPVDVSGMPTVVEPGEELHAGRRTYRSRKRAALTAYGLCLLLVVVLLATQSPVRWPEAGVALALQACVALMLAVPPPPRWRLTPALAVSNVVVYLLSVALLRDAAGTTSGFGPLVLLPVMWATLRARRVEFIVSVVGVAAVYVLPEFVIGGHHYPPGTWRAGLLFVTVSAVVGMSVLRLVERVGTLLERLASLARTDELTGLANRRSWDEALGQALVTAQRSGRPLTVALVDLDDFKAVNDSVGHLAADRMLRAIAAQWRECLRGGDTLARWGGDEFAVLLPDTDRDRARALVERMRTGEPSLSFCAGLAAYAEGSTADQLLAEADEALYRAKAQMAAEKRQAA